MGHVQRGARHFGGVELDKPRRRRRRQHLPVVHVLDRGVAAHDGGPDPTGANVDDENAHCESVDGRVRSPRQLAIQPPMVPPSVSHRIANRTWATAGPAWPETSVIVVAKMAITTYEQAPTRAPCMSGVSSRRRAAMNPPTAAPMTSIQKKTNHPFESLGRSMTAATTLARIPTAMVTTEPMATAFQSMSLKASSLCSWPTDLTVWVGQTE